MGAKDIANTRKVLEEVFEERLFQDDKWGEQNHDPFYWLAVLGEEFGEACTDAQNRDWKTLRDELIQVAAVAVAMVECYDRGIWVRKDDSR